MAVQSAPARAKARLPKTQARPEPKESATDAQVAALQAKIAEMEARLAPRPAAREPVREVKDTGYYDADGNPIARKAPVFRNKRHFEPHEIPEGMEYQWIRHTVHGDPSDSELFDMQENGWRAVPHKRHANRFGETIIEASILRDKGCIVDRGDLLVERPKSMCDEARLQQKREADAAVGNQFRQFSVPLPDNVRQMGLQSRGGVARQMDDVQTVRQDFKPKHELSIE